MTRTSDAPGRLVRDESLLLVVDIQDRLAPHVADHAPLIARTGALLDAAALFGIPSRLTEHCPDQLGPVVQSIRSRFAASDVFAKTRFGAADHPEFVASLRRTGRRAVVIAGMEAHVCVLQTALGLLAQGFEVTAVADAIGARGARASDRAWALERLRAGGATLAGTETVLFEWAQRGDDPAFRAVLALVKGLP